MRPYGTPQQLEKRRRRAVALLREGHGPTAVARMVGVAHGSVVRWRQACEAAGDEALAAKPHNGPRPKLSNKQCLRLQRLLLDGPTRHGYANELWTLKRVAYLIRRKFGVKYDPSGVWHLLRRMGWTCQKPERRARERDERAIARWRQVDWPRIKKSL
jgi:transposase